MKVTREDVRQKVVAHLQGILLPDWPESRLRWPLCAAIDTSVDKSPYINVDLVYQDGMSVGTGPAPQRRLGILVIEVNFKEGEPKDGIKANNVLDKLASAVTDTDAMSPLRTYASKFVSPKNGAESGWQREGLVTPFFYDTSR